MRRVSVTDAKNGLSALLDQIQAGETVLVTERGIPIARISPEAASVDAIGRSSRLARAGLASPGSEPLPDPLRRNPAVAMPAGESVVDLVIEERDAGW